ncbi:hypothetical protein GYMLUDRAFT_48740 [Collybiopsis luxurians FD-317 M1]|uniref:Ankyrin repeat protein n=1 Tax=Collybiopsis luxurians FD-317 M1 TaxID=944289 RepID=A0A0D0AV07_9AGAR|nr:hypothetical protein GYMLUDRAFT_48740 [Collybiopsis luxurians FD-317 M1]
MVEAAEMGHFDIIEYLVEKGANIDTTNLMNRTALHMAASKGHLNIVKYLIENGANACTVDENGESPLGASGRRKRDEVTAFIAEHVRCTG